MLLFERTILFWILAASAVGLHIGLTLIKLGRGPTVNGRAKFLAGTPPKRRDLLQQELLFYLTKCSHMSFFYVFILHLLLFYFFC